MCSGEASCADKTHDHCNMWRPSATEKYQQDCYRSQRDLNHSRYHHRGRDDIHASPQVVRTVQRYRNAKNYSADTESVVPAIPAEL
jgi:hypothetical protein